jgi:hypothetical protein
VAMLVGFIHDVNDHKYPDPTGQRAVDLRTFLQGLKLTGYKGLDITDSLINIADHISYSKENDAILAKKPINFIAVLDIPNLPHASAIRSHVSDADKLKAIGEDGFKRFIIYTTLRLEKEKGHVPTWEELKQVINCHAKEKLLRLKDEFMRTPHGKYLAIKLHNDFLMELESFNRGTWIQK